MKSVVFLCILYYVHLALGQTDPCSNYLTIDNLKRSASFNTSFTDIAISDDRLPEGSYRITSLSGEEMPTTPPGTFKCGTFYPIWLNGNLPTTLNEQVSVPVCVQTLTDTCGRSWDINIRRCDNFLVYDLVQSTLAQSAYCFGTAVRCAEGEFSETGFSPGCTTDVPTETFSPTVVSGLAESTVLNPQIGPSLVPVFRCSFDDVPGQTYAYDIYWYINEKSVVTLPRLSYADVDSQGLLLPTHWVNTYRLNMVVKCSVRARLSPTSVPGHFHESQWFAAGIKPEKTVYHIKEGEEIAIKFTSSVGVGCIGSLDHITPHCFETLKVSQPRYQNNPSECTTNIQSESLAFETQNCGITLSSVNWDQEFYLNVTGYVDNVYNEKDRTGNIRLQTGSESATDLSGVWNSVTIPDIQVFVSDEDSSLTGRICKTWNDPRYSTADGQFYMRSYSGEYIFYRHKKYPYWVHTLSTSCPQGSCNCGIAVRSHDSLFVLRTCDVISSNPQFYASGKYYPDVSFAVCDNKHMFIEKKSASQFKVTLPIGTEIIIYYNTNWVPTINLKPSALDIEQSEGLCGYISKTPDTSDDYMPRGSNTATDVDTFVKSWWVPSNSSESLFSPLPQYLSEDPFLKEYCICAAEAGQSDNIATFIDVHCNLTAPMVQCKTTKTPIAKELTRECGEARQKKSISDDDDVVEETPLQYDPDFDPDYLQPEPVWRNGWDESSARIACTEGIAEMPALQLCVKYAGIDVDLYIESCTDDIRIAGSTEFLPYTIKLIESACELEISRNETLFTNSSDNNGKTVFSLIQNLLCSPNCTKHGYCNETKCICNDGYLGADCSMSITEAPSRLTIPSSGECKKGQRPCSKTNIYGTFLQETVYCKFERFIASESGKQYTSQIFHQNAEYKHENLVTCPFPDVSRRKRSTDDVAEGFDISLSYDQSNYGDPVVVVIYDESCYKCTASTGTCIMLETCKDDDDDDDDISNSGNDGGISTMTLVAVVTLSVVIVLLVIALIMYKIYADKNKTKQRNDTFITVGEMNEKAPRSTRFPLKKESSNLSFQWAEERTKTPEYLFSAQSIK